MDPSSDTINVEQESLQSENTSFNSGMSKSFKQKLFDKQAQKSRIKCAKFSFYKSSKHSSFYLFLLFLSNLLIMNHCSTFNFNQLFLILLSCFFNLILHLNFFYPVLLSLLGSNWI